MDRCAAPGCSTEVTKEGSDFSFFLIPMDPKMKNSWETNLELNNLSQSSVICEKHFSPQDLIYDENGRKTVKPNALPSLFIGKTIEEGDLPVRRSNRKRVTKRHSIDTAGSDSKIKVKKGPRSIRQVIETVSVPPGSNKQRVSLNNDEASSETEVKLLRQRHRGRGRKTKKEHESPPETPRKIKLIGDDERGHAIAEWYLVDIFEATRVITGVLQKGSLVTDDLVANMEETIIEMVSKLLQRLSSVLINTIEEEFNIKCNIINVLKNLQENIKENLSQLTTEETNQSPIQLKSEDDSYEEALRKLDNKDPISVEEEVISTPFDEDCVILEHSYSRPFEQETEKGTEQARKKDRTKMKSKLQCGFCTFKTYWKSKLRCHVKNHLQRKGFDCSLCEYSANSNEAYQKHFRTHTGEKPYCCSECDFRTANKSNLIRHKVIHTGLKPFACPHCDHTTRQKGSLETHIATHLKTKADRGKNKNSVYVCGDCNFVTLYKSELNTHAKTHAKFNCAHCEFIGENLKELRAHQVVHNGTPHICTQCDRKCKSADELRVHLESHGETGEELVCNLCSYRSTRPQYFKRHVAAHWGEKPFKCELCQNSFRLQSHLTMHLRKHEIGPHCKRSSM